LLATVVGLALFALIGIGIRLLMMFTIQQRRERMNRQINERLRALISAYKVLGGSFTGDLTVNPAHLRDLHYSPSPSDLPAESAVTESRAPATGSAARSDRPRRIRDSVEAALSDIFLLGTEEHVRLAERAARELTAGRPVHTHELVVSLRNFIREALDLDPIPPDLAIPIQGPARPSNSAGRGKGERASETSRQGAGGRGGGMGMGGGMGAGLGVGGDENQAPTDHHS
ncbi:MAG: hypothetical protein AB7O71_15990, partial [Hyphomicrobiaceae bacterium]